MHLRSTEAVPNSRKSGLNESDTHRQRHRHRHRHRGRDIDTYVGQPLRYSPNDESLCARSVAALDGLSLTGCALRFCRSHCMGASPAVASASLSAARSSGALVISRSRSCFSMAGPTPGKLCRSSGLSEDFSAGERLRKRGCRRVPAACVSPRWVANSDERGSAPHVSINQRQTCPGAIYYCSEDAIFDEQPSCC